VTDIQFFLGVGSRYSYLAAAQIDDIERKCGVRVIWRPVYTPDLISAAGENPFFAAKPRGQYLPEYRRTDAKRWAAYLDIPYIEPDITGVDMRAVSLWSVAAGIAGHAASFAKAALDSLYGRGHPLVSEEALVEFCGDIGISASELQAIVRSGQAERVHGETIRSALKAGCFGAPSFVTEDGSVFWGQDRIPLLIHHLTA